MTGFNRSGGVCYIIRKDVKSLFIPGETIIHRFCIPFSSSVISKVMVTYKQGDTIILEKTVTDYVTGSENPSQSYLNVPITQTESLLFQDSSEYFVQLNILLTSGHRAASVPIRSYNSSQFYRNIMQ